MIRGKGSRKRKTVPFDKEKTIALLKRLRKEDRTRNSERLKLIKIVNAGKDLMKKARTEEQRIQWATWAEEFNKDLLAL